MEPTDLTLEGLRDEMHAGFAELRDATRANGVLMENMQSQMMLVLEAVLTTRTELKADLAEVHRSLSDRTSVLEEVVRQNPAARVEALEQHLGLGRTRRD